MANGLKLDAEPENLFVFEFKMVKSHRVM